MVRHENSGGIIVDDSRKLTEFISRRDLAITLYYGLSHTPVKIYMNSNSKIIILETTLLQINLLMLRHEINDLPVLEDGSLTIIVN